MGEKLYVGIDLCSDYAQVVCKAPRFPSGQSLGIDGPTEQHLIPVEGTDTEALEKLFRGMLNLTRIACPDDTIAFVCVALEEDKEREFKELKDRVAAAMQSIGIGSDRLCVVSHGRALLSYITMQKRTLWVNDTGVFEFREGRMHFVRVAINKKMNPMVAEIKDNLLSEQITMENAVSAPSSTAGIFLEDAVKLLSNGITGTIFIAGRGFDTDWANDAIRSMCTGRRVYQGQNMYAKGACFYSYYLGNGEPGSAAKDNSQTEYALGGNATAVEDGVLPEVALLEGGMVPVGIYVKAYRDGAEEDITLIKPATPYKEAFGAWDFILDGPESLELRTFDIRTGERKRLSYVLNGLPKRPNRMTRIRLKIAYTDEKNCIFDAEDLGFGDFYTPTEGGDSVHKWHVEVPF